MSDTLELLMRAERQIAALTAAGKEALAAGRALQAENAKLKQDAERYRWLKQDADCEESTHSILFETPASEWDAAIDAAISARREA